MRKFDFIAAWLTDKYARQLLGLASATESRWVVSGEYQQDEPIGFWISIERLEERRSDGEHISHVVSPKMCLLRWDGIITVQGLKKDVNPEIGTQP
jgi:hypothetical protein